MSTEIQWTPQPAPDGIVSLIAKGWKTLDVTTHATPGEATRIDPEQKIRVTKAILTADPENDSDAGNEIQIGTNPNTNVYALGPSNSYNLEASGETFNLGGIFIKSAAASQDLTVLYFPS